MTARELERLMVETFGPDFREKAVAGWPLRECFEECGLEDPKAPPRSSEAWGLWQTMPLPRPAPATPIENARAAIRTFGRSSRP